MSLKSQNMKVWVEGDLVWDKLEEKEIRSDCEKKKK